jgi:hypothetical protein
VRRALGAWALAALAGATTATAQQPDSLPRWELLVGHSYSSARALMQPATLTLEKVQGSPLYSVLDVGALVRGSIAERSWIETGLRARAGSARPSSQRVFGAMARVYRELDPVLLAVGGEYQADGGFDVHTLDATAELTPLGGLPGLGTWVSPAFHLRWRPWIGAAVGDGVRPYARLSADWVQGRLEAGVEETAWLVSGSGRSFLKGDISVQLIGGLFVTASGELGRSPPTWERTGRIGLGLGYRLGPTT